MSNAARDAYLAAEVRTATPQRLRLLLIDGAIRFARRALEHWDNSDQREMKFESIERCRKIIAELFAVVEQDGSELNRRIVDLYLFMFRTLSEASIGNDSQKIHDVLSVLAEERTTWQQVCEQMPLAPVREALSDGKQKEIIASGVVPIGPDAIGPATTSGFSLEG